MIATTEGKFRKARISALGAKQYGMYRGQGRLTVDAEGIKIEGRHVKSLNARWGIGLALVIGSLILTAGKLILGIIPVYFLLEYAILDRENISIPWSGVRKYAFDKHKQIALEFDGPPWTSPSVMRAADLTDLAPLFRQFAPEKDATPSVQVA
jgi:hypothetical protein